MYVTTNNFTGTSAVGKLFVSYDIDLFTPLLEASTSSPTSSSSFYNLNAQSFTSTVAQSANINTADQGDLGIVSTSGVFTLPKGAFNYSYSLTAKDTSAEAFAVTVSPVYNGVTLKSGQATDIRSNTASGILTLSGSGTIISNGSATFALTTTMVGAAGTLTIPAAAANVGAYVLFTLA
jgi:hypothetical protein